MSCPPKMNLAQARKVYQLATKKAMPGDMAYNRAARIAIDTIGMKRCMSLVKADYLVNASWYASIRGDK